MTNHTDLLEQSFELNLNNYGPEDVERLNDWAIKAHNALEALQAEAAELESDYTDQVLRAVNAESERDAALARLAESEAQNLMARQIILEHGEGVVGASPVEPSESVEFAKLEPVYFSQFSGCGLEEVSKDRYDEIAEDDRITYYTAAGASPQQSPLLQFCTCEDCKPMECEGCRINRERRELLPAPGEAAREYMTGYSDAKEWAGAANQAQPSQADAQDAARYRWIRSTTNWASNSSNERIDVRNCPELWDAAIDAAINAKERT